MVHCSISTYVKHVAVAAPKLKGKNEPVTRILTFGYSIAPKGKKNDTIGKNFFSDGQL